LIGETIDWYASSSGGGVLAGGSGTTTFTTPVIAATTIYYAQSRNTTTGCGSSTRTAVTATVNALPSAPVGTNGSICGPGTVNISATPGAGETVDWYAALSGGSVLSGGTGTNSFTTPAISATTNYYAEARNTTTGCISATRTAVTAIINEAPSIIVQPTDQTTCTGSSVSFTVIASGSGLTYQWYTGAIPLTNGGNSAGATSATLTINPVTTGDVYANYNVVVTGICSPSITSNNAGLTVNISPEAPTGTGDIRCGTGTVNISAIPPSGESIDWYAASTGGNVLAGGSSTTTFTTPSISATTIYYAEARNTTTGCVSVRTAVTAIVNNNPTVATVGIRCGTGTVNISATASAGATIDWFAASTGGSVLSDGSGTTTFTTPGISTTTTYYAEARNTTTGCISATRSAVSATVNTIPSLPTGTNSSRCGTGTVGISATPGAGETIDWYAASTGGSILAGGTGTTTFITPSISTTTTYYAGARNTATNCILITRIAVTATVNTLPASPTGTTSSRCGTGAVTISALPESGSVIDWYSAYGGNFINKQF